MKSSCNFQTEMRKPLFKSKSNAGDLDFVISHQPGAGCVMQPDRKRSRTNYSVSSNLQKEYCDDEKQTKRLVADTVDQSVYQIISSKTQDRVECPLIESADKVKSAGSLNVRRKKSSKRTLSSDNEKTISSRDILDDESLWLSTVKNDVCASKISDDHTIDSYTSSQDSFSDLFASSTASTPVSTQQNKSEFFSSQNRSSLKDNNDSMLDFLDVNDSKLAELDVSGIISSYNSGCKDSENQKEKDLKLIASESKNVSQEGSFDTDRCINPFEKSNTCANFINGINYECLSGNATEKLFHGLPLNVENLIKKHKGIKNLYDWQNDCLNLPGVKNRRNLIYSLPTSGGKTLVAEILIMKELICHEKDALLVLPFVSIVQEKVRDMSLFAVDLQFLVEEYAASKGKFPPRKRRNKKSLYIATIEKANGLVNCLIEENRLSEIGLVVVDELHMLGEGGHRGATLEMCLAKIIYCSSSTQIIGMSATLNNITDLQTFLNAEIYVNDFRPVELREFFKIDNEIYEVKNDRIGRNEDVPFKCSRRIKHQTADKKVLMMDPDHLSVLVEEVIPKYSCLFFCPTKKSCENVAELLAKTLPRELKKIKVQEKFALLHSLKSNADGVCPVLQRVIPYGIAYHHGGLTMDERKLIEEAYSQGTLCLLACTSTLAAGVNLPAKRVILRSPYVGRNVMSRSQYKQMIGRAGRAGIDTSGESIMILEKKDKDKVLNLINAPLESCRSSLLHSNGQGLRSLVLSLIGLKICNSMDDINLLISKTLLAVQNNSQGNNTLLQTVYENIDTLVELKLVKRWKSTKEGKRTIKVETTPLGRATFKGCVDVDRSPFIYEEVKRAQENLVLTNDLHLLYLVTTPDMSADIQPSWMTYFEQVSNLNSVEQKASEFIGVSEGYLSRKVSGHMSKKNEQQLSVVKRFYLTLMLYKIINEHSIWDVANTFDIPRGFVQSLFSSSTSFASCLVHFTNELPEFHNIKLLLETIVDKLSYTAVLELVPLMQIPGVKKNRARQLYAAGYRNLQAVAKADPDTLMKEIEYLPKTQAKLLVSAAKMLLLEKAEALQEEAAELIGT